MRDQEITVLYNVPRKPDHPAIAMDGLKEWVLDGTIIRHIFKYKKVQLLAYDIDFIPRPLSIAILLRLMSRGICFFKDLKGRSKSATLIELGKLFWQFIRDFSQKPLLLRKVNQDIAFLHKHDKRIRKSLNLSYSPLYLRTDMWFGITSGGSVGHIAGVLNNLEHFTGKPIFLTTDEIPTIRKDLETHYVHPEQGFWDFKELPSIFYNETFTQKAYKLLEDRKLSFIYQRYSLNNYSGLKLARFYNSPFVLEYNGSEIWINRNWGKPLKYERLSERIELFNLMAADLVVVVSQPMKDELIGRGIEAEKILVNPNGVDPKRYSLNVDGSSVRHQYHLNGNTVIGFIGTFGKWHGAEVLVEALGQLLHRYPEYQERVKLLMIGDGITMPLVKENVDKFAIKESCVLTGLIPQEEGPKYLAACDVLVASHKPNPDGTPFFGSPTKLFEYMAMGKGIVASNLNQIGEVLKHDHTAWMVKPGEVMSLMEGLKVLVDDKEKRERLGRAARQEVVSKYTWKEHTRKIIDKLKERCGR